MKRPPSARKSPPKKRGAKKAVNQSVQSKKQITAMQTRFYLEGPLLTYRDVWRQLNKQYGLSLSLGTVYRMAHDGYMPADLAIRRKLVPAWVGVAADWLAAKQLTSGGQKCYPKGAGRTKLVQRAAWQRLERLG